MTLLARAMLASASVAGLARGASAQPPTSDKDGRAAELYEEGKRHFDIAQYAAAITSWKEAYLVSSAPLLLFNIGQAYRLSGDCAQANRFYLNYRRAAPDASNQAELEKAMQKCAGVEPATSDTSNTSNVPPEQVQTTPAAVEPQALTAPTPTSPTTHPVDAPTRDDGKSLRVAGLVVGGAGAVSSIVAVVYAIRARDKEKTVESQAAGTAWDAGLPQTERDGRTAQTRARVLGVLGVAAVATGGVLWWIGHRRSSTRIDVGVTHRGEAEVSLTCAF